jgi:hypothetical protein
MAACTLRSRLLTLGFLGVLACGGSDPALTQQEALSLWAKAICNAVQRCDPGMLPAVGLTPETCESGLMGRLSASGDPRCQPGDQFDGDASRACIRAIETEACRKEGPPPEPCTRVCKAKG